MGSSLKGKKCAPMGANSSLCESTQIHMGDKFENFRVDFTESVHIHLEVCANFNSEYGYVCLSDQVFISMSINNLLTKLI